MVETKGLQNPIRKDIVGSNPTMCSDIVKYGGIGKHSGTEKRVYRYVNEQQSENEVNPPPDGLEVRVLLLQQKNLARFLIGC